MIKHEIKKPSDIKRLEQEGCEGVIEVKDGKTWLVCHRCKEKAIA